MTTLLIATLPLPPSVNEYYANTQYGRRKTEVAVDFEEKITYCLVKKCDAPYAIHYRNEGFLEEIRAVHRTRSRAKAILAQRKWLELNVEFYFTSERRDIDGGLKPLQDQLTNWIAETHSGYTSDINFSDRQFLRVTLEKFIVPGSVEYCNVAIKDMAAQEGANALLKRAMQEAAWQGYTDPFWSNDTFEMPAVILSQQKTTPLKKITKKLRKGERYDTAEIHYPAGQSPSV